MVTRKRGFFYRLIGECILLLCALSLSAQRTSVPNRIYVGNEGSGGVILRAYPNELSKFSGPGSSFKEGATFECIGIQNGYYKVRWSGRAYYIPMKYASPYPPSSSMLGDNKSEGREKQPSPSKRCIICGVDDDGVVLRVYPDEDAKWEGLNAPHYYAGDLVNVVGEEDEYYKVAYKGKEFYIPIENCWCKDDSLIEVCNADGVGVALRMTPDESLKWTGDDAPKFKTGEIFDCYGIVKQYFKIGYNGDFFYVPIKYGKPVGAAIDFLDEL